MPIPITGLYLAIMAVMSGLLAFPAGKLRGSTGVSIGDGGNPQLLLAMRRHANFVEYVPLLMIMFAALELGGSSGAVLHALGLSLLAVRICHAIGLKADTIESPLRAVGAGGTLLITLIAAVLLGIQFIG
ncbi:MAG: MAPEG family protein [Deltaproteobacteria bacterium]|nr:MAPEG family protein [Deltaproteobacteria bacterium]MBW2394631.1 MAPEG family protein [Deltaproteobacteria bacterium]